MKKNIAAMKKNSTLVQRIVNHLGIAAVYLLGITVVFLQIRSLC